MTSETVITKHNWTSLPGTTLEGGFELGDALELDETTATFRVRVLGDPDCKAYASFFAVEGSRASEQVAIWEDLRRLRHPNLKTPLAAGQMQLNGAGVVYVVLSMPDETLSEILGDRALTDEEGRELLRCMGDGLAHLHAHGFAHGCLSPQSTVSVGEFIQLSTEGVRRMNAAPPVEVMKARYVAPESSGVNLTAYADVWCMGATVFESLVQRKYEQDWFGDLARLSLGPTLQHCLDADPLSRSKPSEVSAPIQEEIPGDEEAESANGKPRIATQLPYDLKRPRIQTREPVKKNNIKILDEQANLALVKFDPVSAAEKIRGRVQTNRGVWPAALAAVAAFVIVFTVIWLVILPKVRPPVESIGSIPVQGAPKDNAWQTKTLSASDAANTEGRGKSSGSKSSVGPQVQRAPEASRQTPAGKTEVSVPPAARASSEAGDRSWMLVLGAFRFERDADRRVELVNTSHPGLDAKKFSTSVRGPFYVVAGEPMSRDEAIQMRQRALQMGIPRIAYVRRFAR